MVRQSPKLHPGPAPWIYLFAVLAWSWTCYAMVIALNMSWLGFPGVILMAAGGLGPLAVALMLIAQGRWDFTLDRNVRSFLSRAFNPRSTPLPWLAAMAVVLPGVHLLLPLLDPTTSREQTIVLGPAIFLIIGFVFGALEEPGWRGYAQEALQRQTSVVSASLIIGIFWALWHLPLFFIEGTYQNLIGLNTIKFWSYMLAIVAIAPIYAWLYNGAGRSIFAAMAGHGLANVAGELTADVTPWITVMTTTLLSLVVTIGSWRWMCRRKHPHNTGG